MYTAIIALRHLVVLSLKMRISNEYRKALEDTLKCLDTLKRFN